MTQDEIIEMARQAGMMTRVLYLGRNLELLEAFAKLVAEKEREDCAELCEDHAVDGSEGEWDICCEYLADRIRDRGQAC